MVHQDSSPGASSRRVQDSDFEDDFVEPYSTDIPTNKLPFVSPPLYWTQSHEPGQVLVITGTPRCACGTVVLRNRHRGDVTPVVWPSFRVHWIGLVAAMTMETIAKGAVAVNRRTALRLPPETSPCHLLVAMDVIRRPDVVTAHPEHNKKPRHDVNCSLAAIVGNTKSRRRQPSRDRLEAAPSGRPTHPRFLRLLYVLRARNVDERLGSCWING